MEIKRLKIKTYEVSWEINGIKEEKILEINELRG